MEQFPSLDEHRIPIIVGSAQRFPIVHEFRPFPATFARLQIG
jgi:hypothetical protein